MCGNDNEEKIIIIIIIIIISIDIIIIINDNRQNIINWPMYVLLMTIIDYYCGQCVW